jgi:hypothetical protein
MSMLPQYPVYTEPDGGRPVVGAHLICPINPVDVVVLAFEFQGCFEQRRHRWYASLRTCLRKILKGTDSRGFNG